MDIPIIHPENRTYQHDFILNSLEEEIDLPKLGVCFALLDRVGDEPAVTLGIARWNFTGEVTIFNSRFDAAVVIDGRSRVHPFRFHLVWDNFYTPYEDIASNLRAHLRKIHWK